MAFGDADRARSPCVSEDFTDIATPPGTTITDLTEDTISSSGTVANSAEDTVSFGGLVTLVKNLSEQLAVQTENNKQQKAEIATLHRQLNAKCEDDRVVFTAQGGRVSTLEKLVEARFDALDNKMAAMKHAGPSDVHVAGTKTDSAASEVVEPVCESCNNKHSEILEELKAHADQIEQSSSHFQHFFTTLQNQINLINVQLKKRISSDELLRVQTRIEASLVSGLAKLSAADATLRREQRNVADDVSALEASVKDLGVESKIRDAKIERRLEMADTYVKNMGRGHECRWDSWEEYKDSKGRNRMYPYEPRKPGEDWGQTDSAVDRELAKLHARIKFLEETATTNIDIVEATGGDLCDLPTRKKDISRLWKKSNAVSSKIDKAFHEIDSLKAQYDGASGTETVQDLEDRVDSLTEEVSSLRTSQQDHRRALYDWSSDVEKNKRNLEEKVTDVASRVESLEQKSTSGQASGGANARPSSAQSRIASRSQNAGTRGGSDDRAGFVGGLPRVGSVYGRPP